MDHWGDRAEVLLGLLLGGLAWIVKRTIRGSKQDRRTVMDFLNAKAQLEICEAEREYLRRALTEIMAVIAEKNALRRERDD